MSRRKEPMTFSGALEVQAQKPLDARTKVDTKADLTDAASFPYAYEGMTVYVVAEKKKYTLIGNDTTALENWREEGSGGGGSADWSDITNKPTDLVQDAEYQHISVDDNLDGDSLNPVQNRVVLGALESMRTAMTGYLQRVEDVETALDGHTVGKSVPSDAVFTDTVYDDTALSARVTANTTAITDRYTKTETDAKIAEAMTDVDNEHFHPVTALPDPVDEDPKKRPKENHEYILIEYEQDGTTIKSETHYLFYGGAYHQKSTGGISLDGYATEEFVNTKTAKMGEFDVTTIPQGPTGANEVNAVLSNKDTENARVSYVRQSDGTLPSAVNLGVQYGLGEDSFELATTGYVNGKTLAPSGWGVARTGVATVTFNSSKWSSSATVDVSGLGFSSGADYDVVAQPTTGGTATPWGNAIAFVNADKGASSFSVSAVTMEETLSGTVNVKYTIFAKGYGGTHFVDGTGLPTGGVMGQVLAKRSDTDGDVLWKNTNTDATSVNKANLQGRMVGVYTDDIGGDTTKRFMVMNDKTNKEVTVSFRNAEAELNETAQLYHKAAVDTLLEDKQDTLVSGTNIKTINGNSLLGGGNLVIWQNFEVGVEKLQGTYTEDGVTYQVYSKIVKIDALPATAGITNYPHGIKGIRQILSAYGFTTDGFVLNAPRQNVQDNIAIYQVSKSDTTGSIAIEVGKDRSSKKAYVVLVYAKNN